MCIFTEEQHLCSYAQTVNSDRFLEMLFCTHSFTSLLRFGSLNALLTLPVEKDCVGTREGETSRSLGETGDIILLNESLRFIQNVASCYALCLTKESVNTATLVHACVCVRVRVPRTEVWVIRVRLKYEVEAGPDLIPSRSGSPDFEKRWAIPLSACWSRFISLCLWENKRRQMPKAPSLLHHSVFTFTFCL